MVNQQLDQKKLKKIDDHLPMSNYVRAKQLSHYNMARIKVHRKVAWSWAIHVTCKFFPRLGLFLSVYFFCGLNRKGKRWKETTKNFIISFQFGALRYVKNIQLQCRFFYMTFTPSNIYFFFKWQQFQFSHSPQVFLYKFNFSNYFFLLLNIFFCMVLKHRTFRFYWFKAFCRIFTSLVVFFNIRIVYICNSFFLLIFKFHFENEKWHDNKY